MAKAIWRDKVLAESDRFELVEGNVYFPPETLDRRRVKALLVLSRPDLAAQLIAGYQAWRDRPEKLIVRVDRTDPSKNIVRGFRAFGRLLDHLEAVESARQLSIGRSQRYSPYGSGRRGAAGRRLSSGQCHALEIPAGLERAGRIDLLPARRPPGAPIVGSSALFPRPRAGGVHPSIDGPF